MKIILCIILFCVGYAQANETEFIAQLLRQRTLSEDVTYSRIIAPALGLNESERLRAIDSVNGQIVHELYLIGRAWDKNNAGDAVRKIREAAGEIDPALTSGFGNIIFQGKSPSALQSRTLFVISKANIQAAQPLQLLRDATTSYKRSGKPDDFVFEYDNVLDLTQGEIHEQVGSETSWQKREAAPAMPYGKDIAIKKCRQILGWRCTTALYHATEYGKNSSSETQFLVTFTYDLTKNADHPKFSPSQSKNQIDGTTSVLVFKESANWLLVYGTDHRYKIDKQSFTSMVQKEFRADTERLRQRIANDLGIALTDIQ